MLPLPPLARGGHASHCMRCMTGLPASQIELDSSRLVIIFYCLGTFDLLGVLNERTTEGSRELWTEWIWEQYTRSRFGAGFRPSPFMTAESESEEGGSDYDTPHIIMTYAALLSLAILRDDFSRIDRSGIIQFLRSCQNKDGSFSTVPNCIDSDLRTVYCAFAISSMLDDWSGVDVEAALHFIAGCRTYEGGYGQTPYCEAHGGTTYTALAALYLAPSSKGHLTDAERAKTIRWLVHNQDSSGGFHGRTNKEPDACYCFWCSASLKILDARELPDAHSMASFIAACQFKYGGIAKMAGETPDPFHTYLSLAALSICPPAAAGFIPPSHSASWMCENLDALLNGRVEVIQWIRDHLGRNNHRNVK